jgi:hypothetical protein
MTTYQFEKNKRLFDSSDVRVLFADNASLGPELRVDQSIGGNVFVSDVFNQEGSDRVF